MKIDQIEAVILTFEVPGSKWNFLLTGTSLFLPAGDVGGEIKSPCTIYSAHVAWIVHRRLAMGRHLLPKSNLATSDFLLAIPSALLYFANGHLGFP